MVINLYNTNESKFHINKQLEFVRAVNCAPIEPYDIETPQIRINKTDTIFNYVGITLGGIDRYYYVVGKSINGKDIILTLKEDYLYTFREPILNSVAHITRSRYGNRYLKDSLAYSTEKPIIQARNLGTCFTKGAYYVMVKGGQ